MKTIHTLFVRALLLVAVLGIAENALAQGAIKRTTPAKPTATTPAKATATPKKTTPTTGTLAITSTPTDAAVKIDGEYKGTTPLTLKSQKPGSYTVAISAEGYETKSQTISVKAGETAKCDVTLQQKQAAVTQAAATTSYSTAAAASGTSPATSNPYIQKWFPVYGVSLGVSRIEDFQKLGYKNSKADNSGYVEVHGILFYDDITKDGVYDNLITSHSDAVPPKWASLGFSWDKSYNEALSLLQSLGLTVTVKEQPHTEQFNGRNVLKAKLVGMSPDGLLEVRFDFENGNAKGEGYSVYAKNSLGYMFIKYHGPAQASTGSQTSSSVATATASSSDVTLAYMIDHPLCYLNSRRPGQTFQQVFARMNREHPEWRAENWRNEDHSMYTERSDLSYRGIHISRPYLYFNTNSNNVNILKKHQYTLDTNSSNADAVLQWIISDLRNLGCVVTLTKDGEYKQYHTKIADDVTIEFTKWSGGSIDFAVEYFHYQ